MESTDTHGQIVQPNEQGPFSPKPITWAGRAPFGLPILEVDRPSLLSILPTGLAQQTVGKTPRPQLAYLHAGSGPLHYS